MNKNDKENKVTYISIEEYKQNIYSTFRPLDVS